jgi:hypothetical protein
MTHSLHRKGTRENLSNDFTLYCKSSRGLNDEGSDVKKRRFLEIAFRNNAINAAVSSHGNSIVYSREELFDGITDIRDIMICCTSKKDVVNILKEALEADIGLSILVQGIFDEVDDCLRQVGLKPHTAHHSLGFWGRTEKLPEEKVLEFTTMCGHGMISANIVKACISDVTSGTKTAKEASLTLARPCVCGIFNTCRAEVLLEQAIEQQTAGNSGEGE